MELKEFLELVGGKEEDIIEYKGEEALRAVKQDGWALQFVREQTMEICLEAVKQEGYALKHVKKQTIEICLEAVKKNGDALKYVDKRIFENDTIVLNGKKYKLINE